MHFLDNVPERERLYPPFEETHDGSCGTLLKIATPPFRVPSAPLIAHPARGRAGGPHLLTSGVRIGREQFQVVLLQ
jgi:hypothetical protein